MFLDIYSKEEYNPLSINDPKSPLALRAKTAKLKDPLLIAERRKQEEDEVPKQWPLLRHFTGIVL